MKESFEMRLNHFFFAVRMGNDMLKMASRVFGKNQAWRYQGGKKRKTKRL